MKPLSTSIIVTEVSFWLARLIQLFAFYVIFHGHYGPGGAFQGGALLAASIILIQLSRDTQRTRYSFPETLALGVASAGTLIFFSTGLLALTGGGSFLNYETIFFLAEGAKARSLGILIVELGIAFVVMFSLVLIFHALSQRSENE